ncbi:short-chain dehydrogenase/reductase family oxidoreductase [Colletotrichum orchidophilum]|uniref:Short-chain dehydrogenase/reductase family oxidoreductase n=1 Tax=Colletotrichum orchidophilum TaxID=1209926 RepID=A0A1G4BGZ9_9PEZI|nr:short-chain dehydrogenase/reductase family oxidoreductase [Colletotrichum orchidophilum]OHF00790.1 short-chain dehydrogenase/reductase family oxidoreductase [Colletotrichum orchidophilum]
MQNTIYVVTGTNKGIGLGLVKNLLTRSFTTVVASVRNDEAAASLKSSIQDVNTGDGSKLFVMLLDFNSAPDPTAVRKAFDAATGGALDRVDVLISNAAAAFAASPSIVTSAEDLRSAFETNTVAPLMVFQGLWPLMNRPQGADGSSAKFIGITSSLGSIEELEPVPAGAYGPSKAALNWLIKSLHVQHENLISVAVHPGFVRTSMGENAARQWNYDLNRLDTIESSVTGVLQVVDGASRESTSGNFVTQTGQKIAW